MTPEDKVKNKITAFLEEEKAKGLLYYERRQAVTLSYHKGVPDIWFCMNGKHYEVEVKKPGGTRSTLQIKYEQIFKNMNVAYACVDSVDAFKKFFNEEKSLS